mgnify:CR=1 FL=1
MDTIYARNDLTISLKKNELLSEIRKEETELYEKNGQFINRLISDNEQLRRDVRELRENIENLIKEFYSVNEKKENKTPNLDKILEAHNEPIDELLLKPITFLDMHVRISNALMAEGVLLIGELIQKRRYELKKVQNLGKKSLFEIIEELQKRNLSLATKLSENHKNQIERAKETVEYDPE